MTGTPSSLCTMVAEVGNTTQTGATPAANKYDANSWQLDPLREGLSINNTIENQGGATGVFWDHAARSREGKKFVNGQIIKNISAYDMSYIAPLLTGSLESTDDFAMTNDPFYFNILKYHTIDQDPSNAKKAIEYYDCKINRFILRGQQVTLGGQSGLALQGVLDIIGKGSAVGSAATVMGSHLGSDASATIPYGTRGTTAANQPFLYSDSYDSATPQSLLLLNGVRITPLNFTLMWHNHLQPAFRNAQEFLSLCPGGRTMMLDFTLPWDATHEALHNLTLTDGTTSVLTFTHGGVTVTWTFTNLQWPNEDPKISGKPGELTFRIRAKAYGAGAVTELLSGNLVVDDTPT